MQEVTIKIEAELEKPTGNINNIITEAINNTKNVQELLPIAELLTRKNCYPEAQRVLTSILDAQSKNGHALYLMGNVLVAMNDIEQAKEYFTKAIKYGCPLGKADVALALVEKALGNKRRAEQLLKGVGESQNRPFPLMMLFSLYMEQSRYDDARKIAKDVCETVPQAYLGYHAGVLTFMSQQRYAEAKDYLDTIFDQFGKQQDFVFDYVSVLLLMKMPDKADKYWKSECDRLDSRTLEFVRIEAQIASELHDKERTLKANKTLYETHGIEDAAVSIAIHYVFDSDFDSALTYLRLVIKGKRFTKAYYSSLFLKAFCEEQIDPVIAEVSYREAIQIYEEAAKKNAVNTYVMSFAAECYRKIGDAENALRCDMIVADFRGTQDI